MSFKTDLKDELRYFGGMSGGEYKNEDLDEAVDSITELVKGLVGEDSNISYHDEGNVRMLHQEASESRMWEMGYNKAKAELKEKLK